MINQAVSSISRGRGSFGKLTRINPQYAVNISKPSIVVPFQNYHLNQQKRPSSSAQTTRTQFIRWPVTKINTILNIVPQGERHIVERFGKLRQIQESGYFFAIPFIDQIAYVIDTREKAIYIPPLSAITKDNVSVEVSGNLFVQFTDTERAAYGALNPLYSVVSHSQSAMRSAIGEMELDEMLHNRRKLNSLIKGSLQDAAIAWGLTVKRYEITDITPDEQIRIAMDKQAAAERHRREQVLQAEGTKTAQVLQAEGAKAAQELQAEGAKTAAVREAEGEAEAIQIKAAAQASAIRLIASELDKNGGAESARLSLARDYVQMYGEMGSKSNTMFFNDGGPADFKSLVVQASAAMNAVPK